MRLSDQQIDVMRILWQAGEATTAQVHAELTAEQDLAYTTVATLLRRLEEKGAVSHRSEGRQFVYRAEVAEADIQSGMVRHLVQRVFRGDATALVSRLLGDEKLSKTDLERIEALLEESRDDQ